MKNPLSHIFQVKIWLPSQVRFGINWQYDFRTSLKFQPLFWLALYINSQKKKKKKKVLKSCAF